MASALIKLKSSFKEMASAPYFLPLMLILIGVTYYFWWTKRNTSDLSQYAGGNDGSASGTSSQTQTSPQASAQTPQASAQTPTPQTPASPQTQTQVSTQSPTQTQAPESVPKTTVVLFYTDWCGHCQNFKPTWHAMMNKYQGQSNIKLDEINCGENKEIAQQYQIEGYPTIIKFSDQSPPKVYEGNRSPADLDQFINSQ